MNGSVGIPLELVVAADPCAKKIQRAPPDREYFTAQEINFTNREASKPQAESSSASAATAACGKHA